MKLYNLLEEIIFEEVNKVILLEGVSSNDIISAINNKKAVNILYRDYIGQPPSKRYILPTVYGQLKNGNYGIRAQQIVGASKRGNTNASTKIFRVDRIDGWFPTNMTISEPVDNYNPNGDRKYDLNNGTVENTFVKIFAQATPNQNNGEINNELNKNI